MKRELAIAFLFFMIANIGAKPKKYDRWTKSTKPVDLWENLETTSAMNDSQEYYAWQGTSSKKMTIRCLRGEASVIFTFPNLIWSVERIGYRLDKAEAIWREFTGIVDLEEKMIGEGAYPWQLSTSNDSIGLWHTREAHRFLNEISNAGLLAIEVVHERGIQSALFVMDGFKEHAEKIKKLCPIEESAGVTP